jgi:hypothetical protein
MALINEMGNEKENVENITLSRGLKLQVGIIPTNAGTISGTSGGLTTLTTVPTGRRYLVMGVLLRLTSATSLTGTGVLSVGTNASTYDNIMPSTVLTGWNSLNEFYYFVPQGNVWLADAGQNIRLNLTGVFGGTVTFEAELVGFII